MQPMLAPHEPIKLQLPEWFKPDGFKVNHDNFFAVKGQEVGRALRSTKPLNNLCKEIPIACGFGDMWQGWRDERPKPMSLKALQDACKAAGKPKAGIGYGHPAHKGFFAGRAKNGLRNDCIKPGRKWPRLVRPDFHFDDIGPRGFFDIPVGGFGAFGDLQLFAGGIGIGRMVAEQETTAEREARRVRREAREQREAERRKQHEFTKFAEQIQHDVLLDPFIDELTAPRANPCEVIAKWVEHYKMNTEGFYKFRKRMINRLGQVGYDLLGSGYFSSAFRGPDNMVYKVNANHCGLDAWAGFATLCMINRKCPNLPVIYDIKFANNTYCAKMELLTPIDSDFNWAIRACGDAKFQGFEQDCFNSVLTMFNCRDNDAINLMDVVRDAAKQTGGWHDIHRENVMYRVVGDSKTLVMTDPIANGDFNMRTFEKMVEEHNTSEFNRKFGNL